MHSVSINIDKYGSCFNFIYFVYDGANTQDSHVRNLTNTQHTVLKLFFLLLILKYFIFKLTNQVFQLKVLVIVRYL